MQVFLKDLKENYNDKYEYVLPEITLDKNLFSSNKFGSLDLHQTLKHKIMIQINLLVFL